MSEINGYENETVHLSGKGWALRTFTEDGKDYTQMYELPSDKGWISDLIIWTSEGHSDQEEIDTLLKHQNRIKPRGNHEEGGTCG